MPEARRSCSSHHAMRCGVKKCNKRFTLKTAPMYGQTVRCPSCKSDKTYSVEAQYLKQLAKEDRCKCYKLPFPHRKGSIVGCIHTKEDEYQDRYDSIINTPRGRNG